MYIWTLYYMIAYGKKTFGFDCFVVTLILSVILSYLYTRVKDIKSTSRLQLQQSLWGATEGDSPFLYVDHSSVANPGDPEPECARGDAAAFPDYIAGRELYGNHSYAQIRGGELAALNIEWVP